MQERMWDDRVRNFQDLTNQEVQERVAKALANPNIASFTVTKNRHDRRADAAEERKTRKRKDART